MKEYYNPIEYFKTLKYIFKKKEKEFCYSGMDVFFGSQGSGKTLSAVKLIKERLEPFPDALLITNVDIRGVKNETLYFKNSSELLKVLKNNIDLSRKGVLIFIDEIHVVLSELFKTMDADFLMFLSQQRKLNINIIGTSQMYNKLGKVLRDYLRQSGNIILCKKLLFAIQFNKFLNMEDIDEDAKNNLIYSGCKLSLWFHTINLYESYDTFAVISQIQNLINEERGVINGGNITAIC